MTIYTEYIQKGAAVKVGEKYLLCELRNTIAGNKFYTLDPDIEGKQIHGMLGRTGTVERIALGVRSVLKLTRYQNGNARITLSDDLCQDAE